MTQDDRMETNPTRANGGPVRGDAPLVSGECPYPAVMATRYPDRAIGTVAGVTIIESHDPQASTYAEHMETITDRAEIRDSDEPDERTPNEVHVDESGCSCKTGPYRGFQRDPIDAACPKHGGPLRHGDGDVTVCHPDGSTTIIREPDERGDFPCCATPAPVGAAVALGLDAARAMLNAANTIKATGGAVEIGGVRIEPCDEYGSTVTTARAESAEAEVGTLRDTLARRTDSHTQLVRENETLRAKVAAVQAVERGLSEGWVMLATVSDRAEFVRTFRAALATTGEGE